MKRRRSGSISDKISSITHSLSNERALSGSVSAFFVHTEQVVRCVTDRQKKFAEYFVQCGNRTEAAKQAGYSDSYSEHRTDELWRNVEIQKYIKELTEKAQDERIMTARERQALLSDIARCEGEKTADRVKAIDTLNKMTGEYVTRIEGSVSAEVSPFSALTTEELKRLAGEE